MKFPPTELQKNFTGALLVSLEAHQGESDSVNKIPVVISLEYGEWALERMEKLQKEFMDIEEIASRDLNIIYKEEIADKNATDRDTPEIRERLRAGSYPDVTAAMLNRETYEPLIWDIIKSNL